MDTVIAQQNDTVDAICYRYYGRTAKTVEAVYAANPRLADIGVILPMGTRVDMPVVTDKPENTTVNLWD